MDAAAQSDERLSNLEAPRRHGRVESHVTTRPLLPTSLPPSPARSLARPFVVTRSTEAGGKGGCPACRRPCGNGRRETMELGPWKSHRLQFVEPSLIDAIHLEPRAGTKTLRVASVGHARVCYVVQKPILEERCPRLWICSLLRAPPTAGHNRAGDPSSTTGASSKGMVVSSVVMGSTLQSSCAMSSSVRGPPFSAKGERKVVKITCARRYRVTLTPPGPQP